MSQAIENTKQYVAQTYRRAPFVISHGDGMRVWDTDGNEYLDMIAGIAVMALGHRDPEITRIIQEQADRLVHVSNLYYTEPQSQLAAMLCENSFADRVHFSNSGTEANEACIKFARKYAYMKGETNRYEIVGFTGAFHGRTMGSLALTPKEQFQAPFKPLMGGAKILPMNDIETVRANVDHNTCAIIVEPIQGEGGVNPVQAEFLQELRNLCDEHGALLIFDEIQCGMGRTGYLWAHEYYGVTPDLMAIAKPLANGLPIGAALMTEEVHSALAPGDHGSTFAAGPLVCSVANHVLNRVRQPDFLKHVNAVAEYLWERLEEINSPHVKEVRGRGLMIGLEVDVPALDIVQAGYQNGLLMVGAGASTVRLLPPLIIEKSDVDVAVERLTDIFAQL